MSDTTKRRLIYLGIVIVLLLIALKWRKPEALSKAVENITSGFNWPNVGSIIPTNYVPSTFDIGNSAPALGCGCSMCGKVDQKILPASPAVQYQSFAGSLPVSKVIQQTQVAAQAYKIPSFGGGGGSSISVGWSS